MMKLLQSNPTMPPKSTLNRLTLWALAALFGAYSPSAIADDSQWTFSSSVFLNTRAEGANLPESAMEIDFPVLIRLHKDFFDFNSAASNGQDIRFEFEGKNLP